MAYNYKSLLAPVNTESGIAEQLLWAPLYDFAEDGIKAPVAPFAAPGDEVTIKTAHVFADAVNGGFAKYQLAPDRNSYTATAGGDKGFVKLTHTATIFIPGSYAEVHEAIKNMINTPGIVLFKDSNCGANMWYQIGNDCAPAYVTPTFESGTTADGVKGYNVTIEAKGGPVTIYNPGTAPKIKTEPEPEIP